MQPIRRLPLRFGQRVGLAIWAALSATSVGALERVPGSDPLDRDAAWGDPCSLTIGYFNICSGALWEWDDFPPESRFGVWLQRRYRDGDGPACDYGWRGTMSSSWPNFLGVVPAYTPQAPASAYDVRNEYTE